MYGMAWYSASEFGTRGTWATRDGAERCRWVIISAAVCLWLIGYRLLSAADEEFPSCSFMGTATTEVTVICNGSPLFIDCCAIFEMFT